MTYIANVRFIPAYWNRNAMARIPARWAGDVEIEVGEHGFQRVQADEASRDACISALIAGLKARGLTGRLRVAA